MSNCSPFHFKNEYSTGVLDGRVGGGTEGAEGVCNPMGGAMGVNRPDPLELQLKSTYGGSHGSVQTCSRGCLCWTSVGGVALGPVDAPVQENARVRK